MFDNLPMEIIISLRATQYMSVACTTLWIYDYLLTLDNEMALVWPSRLSIGKIIFFLNRYKPIALIILINLFYEDTKIQNACHEILVVGLWLYEVGYLWTEVILAMRAWAIWGAGRTMCIVLTVFTLFMFVIGCVLMDRLTATFRALHIPGNVVTSLGLVCAAEIPGRSIDVQLAFFLYIINQSVVAFLTLAKAFQDYRSTGSPLIRTLFHDGLLYYIYNLIFTVANVIVAFLAVPWVIFMAIPLGIFSSIFGIRILLNIRGSYFNPDNWSRFSNVEDFSVLRHLSTHEGDFIENVDGEHARSLPVIRSRGWTWTEPQRHHGPETIDVVDSLSPNFEL